MAGGLSFRNRAGDRMRYKVLHKFHDYKARFKDYHMCVGCGRCMDRCPEYISIVATGEQDGRGHRGNKSREIGQERDAVMKNSVKPVACKIWELSVESLHEYTYRVETDIKPEHGQFLAAFHPKGWGSALSRSAPSGMGTWISPSAPWER